VLSNLRPQHLSATLEGFETTWNEVGRAAVSELFDARVRERQTVWLTGVTDALGWSEDLPPLGEGQVRRDRDRAWVDYELNEVPLTASWMMHESSWTLIEIELPTPPLAPTLERFLAAWGRSDSAGLAAFFSEGSRERMRASIDTAVASRGWSSLLRVLETNVSDGNREEVLVTLVLERGEAKTRWYLRGDATWALFGLDFPKR
jgi:hypothetical protein